MPLEDFIVQQFKDEFPFSPSEDQQEAFLQIARFLRSPEPIFLLNGYAGTGKTSVMAAVVRSLSKLEQSFSLMAPTGRAAKVLSLYSGFVAHTIHKTIYRQQDYDVFSLQICKKRRTLFIVDEASLLSNSGGSGMLAFGTGRLLDDLMRFVLEGDGNKILLLGDNAQLPPVSLESSPALDVHYMERYGAVCSFEMTQVLRQAAESGILYNATLLRHHITHQILELPKWKTDGFSDIHKITGGELMEALSDSIGRYGLDEVVVLCRSNKRAIRYNNGIRGSILFREERLTRGDRVMIVRNNYLYSDKEEALEFIANGDVAQVMRLHHYQERYGFQFVEADLCFPDYNALELSARLLLDTLDAPAPALTQEQSQELYNQVVLDYKHIGDKRKRMLAMREDSYLNALQVKFSTAVTCHKAQGGQWKTVFVDKSFFDDICTVETLRWYYTAFTRAQEQLYLVNF